MITHGVLYNINAGVLADRAWRLPRLSGSTRPVSEPDVTHVKVRYRQPDNGVLYSPQGGINKAPLADNAVGQWLDVYA